MNKNFKSQVLKALSAFVIYFFFSFSFPLAMFLIFSHAISAYMTSKSRITATLILVGLATTAMGLYFGHPLSYTAFFGLSVPLSSPLISIYRISLIFGGILIAIAGPPTLSNAKLMSDAHNLFKLNETYLVSHSMEQRPNILLTASKGGFALVFYYVVSLFFPFLFIIIISNALVALHLAKSKAVISIISVGLFFFIAGFFFGNPNGNAEYTDPRFFYGYTHFLLYQFLVVIGGVLIAIAGPPFSLKDQFPPNQTTIEEVNEAR